MAETFAAYSVSLARSELMRVYESLAGGSLRAALRNAYNSLAASTSSGLIVSATSANAHSVSFSTPDNAGTSPLSAQQMWAGLIDLFDTIAAALPAPASDADVYREMLWNLQPARAITNDYSALRCA